MKNNTLFLCLFALLLGVGISSCKATKSTQAPTAKPATESKSVSNNRGSLEELSTWMMGSFNSAAQAKMDSDYYNITLKMVPIWEDRTDGKWMYVEQAVASAQERPYRQRVYHLYPNRAGQFISEVFKLPAEKNYINRFDAEAFAPLSPDELLKREGCAITMTKKGAAYIGSTNAKDCGSTLRGASYATSKVEVYVDRLESWDQGFDEAGKQVWGAVKAGYVFDKINQ